jgi:hypothetical protein
MLQIVGWLRQKITAVLSRYKRKTIPPPPVRATPRPQPEPNSEAPDDRFGYGQEVPPGPEPEPPRKRGRPAVSEEIKLLRKRRLSHDKFVTPQGELPPPVTREPKPRVERVELPPLPEAPPPRKTYVRGVHHEDAEDVLYDSTEFFGMFNFRDTILQQLERYFVYLARMKKYDKDSYGLYRQYGATLLPYIDTGAHDRQGMSEDDKKNPPGPLPLMPEWFNRMRPTFGCFVYGADPETEKWELVKDAEKKGFTRWVPKFMYITKHKKPPPTLQMKSGGDIYSMTVWWDRPHDPTSKRKYGTPTEFGMFVSKDGSQLIALRSLRTRIVKIWSKKHKQNVRFPERVWEIPDEFESWARNNGEDAQHFLARLFLTSVARMSNVQRGVVRVAASKDNMTAVFSVNHEKMGYFFQDRDIHIGDTGARKRIFHMVKPHTRRDGAEVPLHFRGEREFTWAGYDVRITVPGWDHPNFDEFDVGTIDEHWLDKKELKGMMNEEELGRRLAERIKKAQHGRHDGHR